MARFAAGSQQARGGRSIMCESGEYTRLERIHVLRKLGNPLRWMASVGSGIAVE